MYSDNYRFINKKKINWGHVELWSWIWNNHLTYLTKYAINYQVSSEFSPFLGSIAGASFVISCTKDFILGLGTYYWLLKQYLFCGGKTMFTGARPLTLIYTELCSLGRILEIIIYFLTPRDRNCSAHLYYIYDQLLHNSIFCVMRDKTRCNRKY